MDDFVSFKEHEKFTKNLIMEAQVGFEKRLARNVKANPKAFHSYVRSKQKAKDIVGPLVGNDGTIVSNLRTWLIC